jgi:hypothetical protein
MNFDSKQRAMASPGTAAWLMACALPALALVELGAHWRQVTKPSIPNDLLAARTWVAARQQPQDAIVFAPTWIDPLGRKAFAGMQSTEAATFGDPSRFARIFEVTLGDAEIADGRQGSAVEEATFGAIRVHLTPNTQFAPTARPFALSVDPAHLSAGVQASEAAGGAYSTCEFARTGGSGGIWSPPTAPQQFGCGYAAISRVVLPMLDYRPRSCLFAPPPGGSKRLVLRFADVQFQSKIEGYHGLMVQAEHGLDGADVSLEAFVDAELPDRRVVRRSLGSAVHRDGEGWRKFTFETAGLAGQTGDLTLEIQSLAAGRQYCLDADTR